jgi:AcrR family transcriptional regulator
MSSQPRKKRRPRNSLTAEAILDAAEQAAATGLDEVTIRRLAQRLDSAPMALYHYFATKDDLVDAMLDRVLGRFDSGEPTDDWRTDLATFAQAHRRMLMAHPWAVTVLFSHPSPGLNAVGIGERALAILDRGGIRGERAVAVFSALLALNYGWCAFALRRDVSGPPAERAPDLTDMLQALPVDTFPLTVESAREMAAYGADAHFTMALGLLLDGLDAWDQGRTPAMPKAAGRDRSGKAG